MTASVAISDLAYRWKGATEPALRGVSLAIASGERVALLGPNGAGKSTLVAHLNGARLADPPVRIGDMAVDRRNLAAIRRRVGVVQQDTDDQLFMPTVWEDVAFGPLNAGFPADEVERRVADALHQVGASGLANRTHAALSGGERRRIAIATVLSMDVDVLVLDEPTSNLDGRGRRAITALLATIRPTLIVATHDLELARAACPRIVILDEGRIVADGGVELLDDRERLERHGIV